MDSISDSRTFAGEYSELDQVLLVHDRQIKIKALKYETKSTNREHLPTNMKC